MAEPTLSKKRYVPLVEAGRISGYTNDYIERLCRIGKIPCRMNGDKVVVELDTLLAQTGTILLDSEQIGYIEIADNDTTKPPLAAKTPISTTAQEIQNPVSETERRKGIAVVGETVRPESVDAQPKDAHHEKYPSNALPFFSSFGRAGARSQGVHIAVSRMGSEEGTILPRPDSRRLFVETRDAPRLETPISRVTVMPASVPEGYVSRIAPHEALTPPAAAAPIPSPLDAAPRGVDSTVSHDHDLESYVSKLPMAIRPTSVVGRSVLALLAIGIFVAPATLGFNSTIEKGFTNVALGLEVSGRNMMAAVGIIDPDKESAKFPLLSDVSRLLSASGAAAPTSGSGVVVAPSSGVALTDAQIKNVIQQMFAAPVMVNPDSKDSRTGIIQPVFQKPGNAKYIYVMVPVKS